VAETFCLAQNRTASLTMTLLNNTTARTTLLFILLLPTAGGATADHTGDQILGKWLFPAKGSSVEIYRNGNQYFARIADVATRGVQEFGITKDKLLMKNLTFDGSTWSGGKLIHPRNGISFDVELHLLDPKTLEARVSKGFRFIGKEFVLTRP